MKKLLCILLFSLFTFSAFSQNVVITQELIQRLKKTNPVNMTSVIQELELENSKRKEPKSFSVPNPYYPHLTKNLEVTDYPVEINGIKDYVELANGKVAFHHQLAVHHWGKLTPENIREQIVCGFKFLDQEKNRYLLKTFKTDTDALSEGFIVTHQNRCGACSSLKDLAIFLEVRDMTGPARTCTKKLGLKKMMECNQQLGLTKECSEAWAYNSQHTKKECLKICLKDYGLWNIIRGKYPGDNVDANGVLRACILCDEVKSGLAYKYVTGRSRRSSGIESAIRRSSDELYPIDFKTYYQAFSLEIK